MEWLPLKRLARLRYGASLPVEDRVDGDYPVLGSGGESGTHATANVLGPGIVVGRKGSYGAVYWTPKGCFAIDTAYFIDATCSSTELRWLYYALQAVDIRGMSQDVGVPGLSRKAAHEALIPSPDSMDEQRRIAAFLDEETGRMDRLRSALHQTKQGLLERREAAVWTAVTGGDESERRPTGVPWIDSLPASWGEVRLGLVAHMGSGHTPSRSHPEWWVNCTIPWITTGEVADLRDDRKEVITETREHISRLGLANSAAELHPEETVVLCRTASAGYSAVMGSPMATSQDFVTWTCGPRLNQYYLLWCLRAMRRDLLGRLAMGSTHQTIYVPDLQMLRIPLPSRAEQERIVYEIRRSNEKTDRLVDNVDHQLTLLAERRQALITAAVTGQLDASTASGRFAA